METNFYYRQGSSPDFAVTDQNKWYVTREVTEYGRRLNVSIVEVVSDEESARSLVRDLQKQHIAAVRLGKAGGRSTSDAKRAASAANGQRGGRTRKIK